MTVRRVLVTEEFLDRLDMLLPTQRTVDGTPSADDFLRFELPLIVDLLAVGYERYTQPQDGAPGVRAFTFESQLVGLMTLLTALNGVDDVEICWPLIHDLPPGP